MPKHIRPARRHWALLQSAGVGLLVAAVIALGLVTSTNATTACANSGDQCLSAAQSVGTVTAGTPFSSGQTINIVIPANSAFASPDNTSAIEILECSAPNGVIPTLTTACDGNTVQGPTVTANANGSFTLTGYSVYALPDSVSLGEGSGGPVCGNTLATECILYIGNNQNNFTAPHLWSQGFFISPNATDNGAMPGDGSAPVVASVPTKANSTVVPSPTTVPADGVNSSTVTVTLKDAGNTPVSGKAVTLSCTTPTTGCTTHITGPSSAQTDVNGQTTFTVTDTSAQAVSLTATDTTDSVPLTPASITFQTPAATAANSSVSANPTTVPTGSTTVTVTLRDQGIIPQPIAGDTVTLAQGSGHAVITPGATPNKTNASGVATFTATDTTAETVTFTATDTTNSTVITNTASVTFGNLAVSGAQSTVTAASPASTASAGTTAVVTLLTSTDSPVAGKTVSLQASSSTAVIGASSPAMTGSNGQVSFTVADSVAESVTLTAKDTTDGTTLTQTPTVVFETPAPSAAASSVLASATTSPADGETQTLIRVIISDQFGSALSGKTVTMQGSPGGNVQVHPTDVGGTGTPGVTNSNGEADFQADDTVAETVTFTATDTTDSFTLAKTVTITFTPGPADPASIGTTVTASPMNPPADGSTPSTVTVTLTDFFSNPIAGKTISLKALNGSSSITPATAVTGQNGQATFSATDATAEVVTYQATDVTDANAVLDSEAVVTFGKPPAPPPDATFCSVAANPTSVPADGTHTATVSVLLYDGNGDPVSGKAVTLAASAGNSKIAATNATTNNSGMATFAVSDSTTESVKYTATDTTDNVPLTADPVTVTFTAAAAGSTTTTTTTTTTTSPGATTTTTLTNAAAVGTTSAGVSAATSTGNTGTGASSPTLAATGSSTLLPWLVGLGVLFLMIGTIGRRRLRWQHQILEDPDEAR
jgi:hypothetical protein